jgi:hypothetical protein
LFVAGAVPGQFEDNLGERHAPFLVDACARLADWLRG